MAEPALKAATVRRKAIRPIRIDGDRAFVPLTKGMEAVIDASDVPLISGNNWFAHLFPSGHAYAARSGRSGEKSGTHGMHRVILGVVDGEVDHINGDGLDNRRSNLRHCTHKENLANQVVNRRNKLGIKGVIARAGRYRACIQKDRKTIWLGSYGTPEEASAAYYGAARVLYGDFARKV